MTKFNRLLLHLSRHSHGTAALQRDSKAPRPVRKADRSPLPFSRSLDPQNQIVTNDSEGFCRLLAAEMHHATVRAQ